MPPTRPRLLFLVTEDWFFRSHRLPMARAAQAAGFEVHVATHVTDADHRHAIAAEGFTLHPMPSWRRSLKPWHALAQIRRIRALYHDLRPDIVHHIAIMPVLLGSIAAEAAPVGGTVNSLTGLGYIFTSQDWRARLLRPFVGLGMRMLLNREHAVTVVQNEDDRQELVALGLVRADHTALIRGSGVDIDHFTPILEPHNPPFVAAYVGRMLEDKGVAALVDAHRRLRDHEPPVRLILAGAPDPKNPSSIDADRLRAWDAEPGIEWWGQVDDVRRVWAECHVAVLPSRREGLPKSLMEAAACGRALVATDVPGCREVVQDGHNGLLVPPDDPVALAAALSRLAKDPANRRRLAANSRGMVVGQLCETAVTADIQALYRARLAKALPTPVNGANIPGEPPTQP